MKRPSRLSIAYKAIKELGPDQVGLYAVYKLGINTGHYQRQLSRSLARVDRMNSSTFFNFHPCLSTMPDRDELRLLINEQASQLYAEANEIIDGKVRLFGSEPVPLILKPSEPLADWMEYERSENMVDGKDIKITWEPARFGWACTLARAFYLSRDEKYADCFWENTEHFLNSNPPYLGPHWTSAQEAAIRLIALAYCYQVFKDSSRTTTECSANLARSIAIHAERIPPTMVYARSQNNNHLISEALGLYTASALLPEHPLASKWHSLGWKWLQHAFRTQIEPDGTYVQHSTNYHRLMLQAGLWTFAIHDAAFANEPIPGDIKHNLSTATYWLWKLVDTESGCVPNLGHNDGAYILPLTITPITDYRPVLLAAILTFLNQKMSPDGPWSEMSLWLSTKIRTVEGVDTFTKRTISLKETSPHSPHVMINSKHSSWAYFRVARYRSRPAHADQLHLDLWWRGLNITQDAGTYLYNASPPWDNSLTHASVHNTVTVDGMDFMTRSSKFLFLDWAQSQLDGPQVPNGQTNHILSARHDGYRKIGVTHTRQVSTHEDGRWEVADQLVGPAGQCHTARLHWLLPDWEYEIQGMQGALGMIGYLLRIHSPAGWINLTLRWSAIGPHKLEGRKVEMILARAGEILYGQGEISPNNGWSSPTYGLKIPALACILEVSREFPIELTSEWIFPDET